MEYKLNTLCTNTPSNYTNGSLVRLGNVLIINVMY